MRLWELFESVVEERLHIALKEHLKRLKSYNDNLLILIDRRGLTTVETEFNNMVSEFNSTLWIFGDALTSDVKIKLQYTEVLKFQNKLKTRILHGI